MKSYHSLSVYGYIVDEILYMICLTAAVVMDIRSKVS